MRPKIFSFFFVLAVSVSVFANVFDGFHWYAHDGLTESTSFVELPLAPSASFSNSALITIPASGSSSLYPSTVNVTGLSGTITNVTATLNGVTHPWPDDMGVLLVGPTGVKVRLMTDAGGNVAITNVNLTFDQAASNNVPDNSLITSGSYKPTQGTVDTSHEPASHLHAADFPSPAPASPYSLTMASFNGASPNGIWSLYVDDDATPDGGSIQGGWTLTITTTAATVTPVTACGRITDPAQSGIPGVFLKTNVSGSGLIGLQSAGTNVNGEFTMNFASTDPAVTITPVAFSNLVFTPSSLPFNPQTNTTTCSQPPGGSSGLNFVGSNTNDGFNSAEPIPNALTYGVTTGNNLAASMEAGEPSPVIGQQASRSVWYRWTAPSSGNYTFTTANSSYDTLLAVYTGAALNNLGSPIASNDNDGANITSLVTFNATAGTVYRIQVAGKAQAKGDLFLTHFITGRRTLAGYASDSLRYGVGGITISADCTDNHTITDVVTDSHATYIFDLASTLGVCTVQPQTGSSAGNVGRWAPESISGIGSNKFDVNFVPDSPSPTIAGNLAGLSSPVGVTVVFTDFSGIPTNPCTPKFGGDGVTVTYQCLAIFDHQYRIGILEDHHYFLPGSRNYSITDPFVFNYTGENYTALPAAVISGHVTNAGSPMAGVTLTLTGSSAVTTTSAADGSYKFAGLAAGGSYAVAASLAGSTFNQLPPFNNLAADQTANFVAALPQADLALTKSDGVTTATPGGSVTYTIIASNNGPSAVTGATVTDTLPAAISSVTWTCVGTGGGTCTASGSGNLNTITNLPVGASVTYMMTANISPAATGTLSNTAAISVPTGFSDPIPSNNSGTDTDVIDAAISVSGRVTTPTGTGLRNAIVFLTDPLGVKRTATTSSFGFYQFDNVAFGQTYTMGVASRSYRFSTRQVNVNGSLTNIDFVGLE